MNKLQFFIHHDSDALRIELAGSLSCPDVESVLQAWQKEFSTAAGRTLVADISYVADADKHGRALLAMWHRSGARIVARSPQSWALAKPIVNQPVDADAPKRGWLRRLIDLLAGARSGPVRITVPAEMPCPSSVDLARKTSAVLMH